MRPRLSAALLWALFVAVAVSCGVVALNVVRTAVSRTGVDQPAATGSAAGRPTPLATGVRVLSTSAGTAFATCDGVGHPDVHLLPRAGWVAHPTSTPDGSSAGASALGPDRDSLVLTASCSGTQVIVSWTEQGADGVVHVLGDAVGRGDPHATPGTGDPHPTPSVGGDPHTTPPPGKAVGKPTTGPTHPAHPVHPSPQPSADPTPQPHPTQASGQPSHSPKAA